MKPAHPVTDLHDYQCRAIRFALDREVAMLTIDVGLGKTVIALSAILDRLDALLSFGVLVIAPKRVCRMVWRQEAQNWLHTRNLKLIVVQGTPKQREYLLRSPADIHLINYNNVPWLADMLISRWLSRQEYPPFRTVIYDEVDKLKQSTGVWSKSWQRVMPYIPYRIGMTGTPAGNGLKDLFGQYLVIDGGYRLGTSYEAFLSRFFFKTGYRYELRPGAAEEIKEAVADITLSMTQKEYLPWLLDPLINDVWVELPTRARAAYDQLEREMFMELDAGAEVEVFNQAALINKCLQAANGQPYLAPGTGEWAPLHDAKLDALEDIVEESNGQPILVAWQFIPDRLRIMERFPQARVLGGTMTEAEEAQLQEDWDAGKIPMLLGHPASMGHGLNLQHGGHIGVWFGLNWSLGLYQQFMGRLARQGQTKAVVFHRILCLNTVDQIQLEALEAKDVEQTDLKQTINHYRERKG